MLFRTIYGPEIVSIYRFFELVGGPLPRQALYEAFMPTHTGAEILSTQNVDDSIAFLLSASMICEEGAFYNLSTTNSFSPRLLILRQMTSLMRGEIEAIHTIDPLYMYILKEIFIKPDRLFVLKMHTEVNKLQRVKDAGGLSKEKVQSWKRFLTFLGVGRRISGGFQCVYAPDLVREILCCWPERTGTLQSFLETHLSAFLPVSTRSGDIASAVSDPLRFLAEREEILLESRQDSSSRAYFGEQKFQYITYAGGAL